MTLAALTTLGAGASLVQLYSALVYAGPGLIGTILDGLRQQVRAAGKTLSDLRGADAAAIAHHGLSGT